MLSSALSALPSAGKGRGRATAAAPGGRGKPAAALLLASAGAVVGQQLRKRRKNQGTVVAGPDALPPAPLHGSDTSTDRPIDPAL